MSQHQPHVLVVDAHPKHANIMRTALSTLTDRVDVADSHAAAIAALSDGHFELVLIDDSLAMPNGFDVLHWIQSFDPPPALIVLSEDRGVERRAAALGGGAVDYVVKRPNYEHSLLQAVSRMLACERAAGPSKLTAAAGPLCQ
jgi:CheY-like chemotaxis protein